MNAERAFTKSGHNRGRLPTPHIAPTPSTSDIYNVPQPKNRIPKRVNGRRA